MNPPLPPDTRPPAGQDEPGLLSGDPAVELSSNRTAMSFERTRASADRTLMSVIRTSLSLIGFGFTIFQVFHSMARNLLPGVYPEHAPRNFALALILLGIVMLLLGILNHVVVVRDLRTRRARLMDLGLIRHGEPSRASTVAVIAVLLLAIGLTAFASIAFRAGPFS